MTQLSDIQWVVQRNITDEGSFLALKAACDSLHIDFVEVEVIPFTSELPAFSSAKPSIFYGSTTFMYQAYQAGYKGIFYDEQTFTISNYLTQWGNKMLNYGAQVTTFRQLMQMDFDKNKLLFIRPDADSKSFAGETRLFKDIEQWCQQLQTIENSGLTLDTPIIVSEPYNIKKEWRLWIVDQKVVAASQYRAYFKLKKSAGCPPDVIAFVLQCCTQYIPHTIFVMDIGLCGEDYFIIECGCMNSAGFYHADIREIVEHVSRSMLNKL